MGVEITKKGLRAVANLMPEHGTYLQRVDRIAAALGYRNNATLMSEINKENPPSPAQPILKRPYALDEVGLTAAQDWKKNLLRDGLFLFVGPTGSGKATLLQMSAFEIQTKREPLICVLRMNLNKDAAHAKKIERLVETSDVSLATAHASTPREALRRLELCGHTSEFFDRNLRGLVCSKVFHHAGKMHMAADCVIFDTPEDVKRMRNGEVFWKTMEQDEAEIRASS